MLSNHMNYMYFDKPYTVVPIPFSTLYHTIPILNNRNRYPSENIVGKGGNAGIQHFVSFSTVFSTLFKDKVAFFEPQLICRLHIVPTWMSLKCC